MRIALLALAIATPAWAQSPTTPDVPLAAKTAPVKDFSFIVMPIPISDPMLGNGLAAGAVALYKVGGSERPWATGVGGLYTDTDSYAAFVFQRADFGGDRFRLMGAAGGGVFNVDFYGVGSEAGGRGISIPIEQKAVGGLAQGLVKVAPHAYLGLQYRYIGMDTTIRIEDPPFPDLDIPPLELESATGALGVSGEYDSRDNEFQPGKGLYATGVVLRAAEGLGGDFDYTRAEFKVNGYHRVSDKSVLAWRGSTCWAGDGAPFYDICNFGTSNDLRGYPAGQYRDRSMFAVQGEYRRKLFGRFGAVAFAGVGEVAEDFGDMGENLLPAAGVGLRFNASKKYGVNVSVDYAVGEDSHGVYFYVGEAF